MPDPHIQGQCPLRKNKLGGRVWRGIIFRKEGYWSWGGPLFYGRWEKIVGGWGKALSRWRLHTANTQKYSRLPVYSESTEHWEVPKAESSLWVFLNFHSITLLWAVNCVPEKSQQGKAWWEMDISCLNVSQCCLVTPVSSYWLSWLSLCPLWGFLISCWASNGHVNPECNCEAREGWDKGSKLKKKDERKGVHTQTL